MRLFSEGAEAKMYLARMLGREIILKRREAKRYRISTLDRELRRGRTRREAKTMHRLRNAGMDVPAMFALGASSIYMERLRGRLLKDTAFKGGVFESLGSILAKMHENGVAHGDFTPANIMLCGRKIYVIDFGLSEITNSIEGRAFDLLLMKRSVPPDLYKRMEKSYAAHYNNAKRVLERLEEIEMRGRYQVRTLG